jgi:hypothetical protein
VQRAWRKAQGARRKAQDNRVLFAVYSSLFTGYLLLVSGYGVQGLRNRFRVPEIFVIDLFLFNRLISNQFFLVVRKILTTKSEIIQLTSFLLPNKLSCD